MRARSAPGSPLIARPVVEHILAERPNGALDDWLRAVERVARAMERV